MEKKLMITETHSQDRPSRTAGRGQHARKGSTLALLRENPEQGLERLVDEYGGYVQAIVAGRLRGHSRQDIEEVVSDVFYAVYNSRDSIDEGISPLKGYICTVAKRKAIDRLRQLTSGKASINRPTDAAYNLAAQDPERNHRLLDAIESLNKVDASIIKLKYYFDMTNAEIGRRLDMKENTVSKRASRALDRLAKILEED